MKKFGLLTLLLSVIIMFSMSSGVIQKDSIPPTLGLLIEQSGCNDYYFVANLLDTKIYELHGYEYGCGQNDRIATGTLHIAGGIAYFGWTTMIPQHDYGQIGVFSAPISLSTKSGIGMYMYMQSDGGVLGSSGSSSSSYSVSTGSDPSALAPLLKIGEDETLRY